MGEKLLTDRTCKAAKQKPAIYYKSDGAGLRLQVRPDGARYWMLRYNLAGSDGKVKESTAGLGAYPEISLEEARSKAAAARKLVAVGIRPSIDRRVRRAQNVERGEATFQALAVEWLARNRSDWSPPHYERNEGLLRRLLFPDLGALPVGDITEQILLATLRKIYDAGTRESARRARAVAAQVFRHAKDTHRATHNPARELADSSLLKKPEVKHFAALKPAQVGPLLRKLEESVTEPATRPALLLMLYTGLRDFSLRAARWKEIDLRAATWTVPASRMKSRREHVVPLPRQAVVVLKELAKLTRTRSDAFVFASRGKTGFLSENTLRKVLHRLGFKVTVHGLRSLLTDLLNEQGFNADAIERQLDHMHADKVRASYLRSDFMQLRKSMMQWLADWADAQQAGSAAPELPANVVTLRRVA
jgi:integrase